MGARLTMVWPFSSTSRESDGTSNSTNSNSNSNSNDNSKKPALATNTSASSSLVQEILTPTTLLSTTVLTSLILGSVFFYRRFLRRITTTSDLPQAYVIPSRRRFTRSLFGHVTAVRDPDNFRLYHTPLGYLSGFGLGLRRLPPSSSTSASTSSSTTPAARGKPIPTLSIRIAGIDAPELAHFGKPAQPSASAALAWLTNYILHRRVRCYIHRVDQYNRLVATVYVRRGLFRRDVGLQMLRAGWATVYEAKTGVVFGGPGWDEKYKEAEEKARRERKGMWAVNGRVETPREFKNRMRGGSMD